MLECFYIYIAKVCLLLVLHNVVVDRISDVIPNNLTDLYLLEKRRILKNGNWAFTHPTSDCHIYSVPIWQTLNSPHSPPPIWPQDDCWTPIYTCGSLLGDLSCCTSKKKLKIHQYIHASYIVNKILFLV